MTAPSEHNPIYIGIELLSFACMILFPLARFGWNKMQKKAEPHWVHAKVFSDAGHGYLLPSLFALMSSPVVSLLKPNISLITHVGGHSLFLAGGLAIYYIIRELGH
jgi:hypothetical protein